MKVHLPNTYIKAGQIQGARSPELPKNYSWHLTFEVYFSCCQWSPKKIRLASGSDGLAADFHIHLSTIFIYLSNHTGVDPPQIKAHLKKGQ